MNTYVLWTLFNELRNIDKMLGLQSILYLLRNAFDKFNITGAVLFNSINVM